MPDGPSGSRWRCRCDDCDAAGRCCSPLTRAAVGALVEFRPGMAVLVLGVPAHELLGGAARAVGPTGRITVVPGPGDRAPAAGIFGGVVQVVAGTLERIPLPAACVDLVTSCCTIHRVGDPASVYREIHRLLRAGGRLLVSDLIAQHDAPAAGVLGPAMGCRPRCVTEAGYVEAVRGAGFRDLQILQRTAGYDFGGALVASMVVSATRP